MSDLILCADFVCLRFWPRHRLTSPPSSSIAMTILPRVKSVSRPLVAAATSSLLSAAVYFWLAPLLAPSLSAISRPVDSFPWWAPAVVKLVEAILLSTTSLANGRCRSLLYLHCSMGCSACRNSWKDAVPSTSVFIVFGPLARDCYALYRRYRFPCIAPALPCKFYPSSYAI